MKSQKSINRKAAKAKARRKDFVRRKNINSNVPTIGVEEKVEVFSSKTVNGKPQVEHIGYKTKIVKKPVYSHHEKGDLYTPRKDEQLRDIGMIAYPKSRKFLVKK